MNINCNEINQAYAELMISFRDCNKFSNADLRRLTDLSVALSACNSGEPGQGGGLQTIETDESLYFDVSTMILRSNVGESGQMFVYMLGLQEFKLVDKPIDISHIQVNGIGLNSPVTDWNVFVNEKKVKILKPLNEGDIIKINYKFLITE